MTSEFQEISSYKLLENAKKIIQLEDLKTGLFYLNLIKYSSSSEYIGAKINVLFSKVMIFKKMMKLEETIQIGKKIIKWKKMLEFREYNSDILVIILEILLTCVDVTLENGAELYSGWFLYISKNISMENIINNEKINEKIKLTFPKILKKLNDIFHDEMIDLNPKKDNLKNLNLDIKNYLNSENTKRFSNKQEVYIISKKWLDAMISFIDKFTEENLENKAELFSANKVCLLYYDENLKSNNIDSYYCGPINNFLITRDKKFWKDSQNALTTNRFLKRDIINGKDYEIIPKELYDKINFYFKNNGTEVKRYCIDDNSNVELYLFEIYVLFINEYLREKSKEDLAPKLISISHFCTIKDLCDKIEKVFIEYANEKKFNDYDYEFKSCYFKYDKKTIIELIISYYSMNKQFIIEGEKLDNENILNKKIYEVFGKDNIYGNNDLEEIENNSTKKEKNFFIITEVISKNSIVSPFLKLRTDKLYCSLCNFQIESKEKSFKCFGCSQGIYCSEKCKSSDHQHIEFHKRILNLYESSIKTEEIKKININSFLGGKSKHGIIGIKNPNALDFLIAPVQVLSHCTTLTKYFLSDNYKQSQSKSSLNDENNLLNCYANLINELWVSSSPEVSIQRFKNSFFSLLKDISNLPNIDAFDMLIVLLDKLHCELNEIKNKPENLFFYEEEPGETDIQACNRWWKVHTAMNKSIIIDLFQGQFKMKVKCPYCKNISITFPPFLYIGLNIPNKDELTKIHFKVFPYDMNYRYVNVELFDINKFTNIKNIKKRINQYSIFSNSKIEAILYRDCIPIKVLNDDVLIYDYIFTRYNFSDEVFTDWEISFIEVPNTNKSNLEQIKVYVTPITFEEEKGYFFTTKNIVPLTYTRLFCMNSNLTLRDMKKSIFKYYRRSMDDKIKHDIEGNVDESYYIEFYQKINDDDFMEDEYKSFTENNEDIFQYYFYHNFEKNSNFFYSREKCNYCNSSKGELCKINLDSSIKLNELLLRQKVKRDIFILVDFSKYSSNFNQFYTQLYDKNDPRMSLSEDINIYDCFDISKKEEKIKKEKDYLCPHCSRHIEPIQQLEPFKSSEYLILNIKRVKKKFEDLIEMINNKKNETLVEYPIENLDLTNYFIGENNGKIIYDLYGIICHRGPIKNGHYYAICRNEDDFYEFDDDKIKKLEKKGEVITKDAMALIYKKRENKSKLIKVEENLLKNEHSINNENQFGEIKNI